MTLYPKSGKKITPVSYKNKHEEDVDQIKKAESMLKCHILAAGEAVAQIWFGTTIHHPVARG